MYTLSESTILFCLLLKIEKLYVDLKRCSCYYLYRNHYNYAIISVDFAVIKTSDQDKSAPKEDESKNKLKNGKVLL